MASLLYIFILIYQVASIKVDVPRDEPRAAILFVGRSLADRFTATHGSENIFDLMTGEEEGEEGLDAGRQPSSESSGWGNAVEMLIEPVKKTHAVDVFICTDHASGHVPADVSQVFEVTADGQEARGVHCVSKLKENGRQYEWLIKVRADFIFFKQFPSMTSLQPGYVHTRFRIHEGVNGLTSDHIAWDPCDQRECPSSPPDKFGYMNDDMVRVIPGALIDFAFLDERCDSTPAGEPLLRIPKSWPERHMNWPEGLLTRFWLERGILTKPLACSGYPKHDRYDHYGRAAPCAFKPIVLVNCTSYVAIEYTHKAVCIENHLPDNRC